MKITIGYHDCECHYGHYSKDEEYTYKCIEHVKQCEKEYNSITYMKIENIDLTDIILPTSIQHLIIDNCVGFNIKNIKQDFKTLYYIEINNTNLIDVNEPVILDKTNTNFLLNNKLIRLTLYNCNIQSIIYIPDTLEVLNIIKDKLEHLSELKNIISLNVNNNKLHELPKLTNTIRMINVLGNPLKTLPDLNNAKKLCNINFYSDLKSDILNKAKQITTLTNKWKLHQIHRTKTINDPEWYSKLYWECIIINIKNNDKYRYYNMLL